ncbi:hypothetical protein [Streptomyces bohaiensis]|uniref:hypothetical protein n=1 Tax=Streptomyces bohaiensis TaxID=1431344 RepID=UPI003B824348
MPRQLTRRTTRSAALTAGVLAATLALAACGSDDSADDDAQATETVASETETGTEDDTTSEQEETTEDDAADAGGVAEENGEEGEFDRTEELPDGSTADIYEIDFQTYRAEIVGEDGVLGTLRADEGVDGIELNAMYVVLETDGSLHAWTDAGEQGPGTFTVDGGWEVEVTHHDDTHWEAKVSGGEAEDTITANGEDAVAHANGIYIVLTWAGVVSSHDPEAESTE